jgi:hypothetical protein
MNRNRQFYNFLGNYPFATSSHPEPVEGCGNSCFDKLSMTLNLLRGDNCHFFLLALLLFLASVSSVLAQEKSNFSEKNLPEESAITTSDNKTENHKTVTKSVLVDRISNSFFGKISSLMFDEEENDSINRAADSLKNNQIYVPNDKTEKEQDDTTKKAEEKSENEKSYIYLGSIIYFTPKDWVVWVNEKKITPENNKKENELYLRSIQKDQISLVWTLAVSKWKILSGLDSEELAPKINDNNQVEVQFDLKPNQTFILNSNNVVEGRAVIALLKKKKEEKKIMTESSKVIK